MVDIKHPLNPLKFSHKVVLIYILLQHRSVVGEPYFLGRHCSSGGLVNVPGQCKLLSDCQTALSNLRAGVHPSLCYQEDDVPVICCPNDDRISSLKCQAYTQQVQQFQAKASLPEFAPFYSGGYHEGIKHATGSPTNGCNSTGAAASPFISGGRAADRHEMTFTVALGYQNGGKLVWNCGGTLISEQYVVTAAHCVDGKASKPPTHVLLGDKHLVKLDTFSSSTRIEAKVAKIMIHPEYRRPEKYNDIGLIKLDHEIKFNRGIQPVCLPQPKQRPESWTNLLVAGWGLLEYFGNRGDVLQVTNITKYSTKECSKNYQSRMELPEGIIKSQICAGDMEGSKDTCDGDSGGPLVSKGDKYSCMHTIIGLTSFGAKLCGSGTPAVYTNVQSYLDWIESVVWEDEYNV